MNYQTLALEKVEFADKMLIRHLHEVHQSDNFKTKAYQIGQVGWEFVSLAEFSLYLGTDAKKIKQWFYMAALADQQEHLFWKRAIEQGLVNMDYEKGHIKNVSSTVRYGLVYAILSDNWAFCREMASKRCQITPVEFRDAFNCAQAIFCLIIDQPEQASERLNALKSLKKIEGFLTGYILVLEGILTKNEALIEQGIARQSIYHKRSNKGSILIDTSLETTMLAKLASRFGFHLGAFNNSVIHQDMLYIDTDIFYENAYKGISFPGPP
jgi:hypothetical protein